MNNQTPPKQKTNTVNLNSKIASVEVFPNIGKNPNTPVILSVDAAQKTGWAIYKNGRIIEHGTKQLKRTSKFGSYGEWLKRMINKYNVNCIVAEDVFRKKDHTRENAYSALTKMQGVLLYVIETEGLESAFLNPLLVKDTMIPTVYWKKHERTEDKKRMINRVQSLGYGLDSDTADDEADAIGILITYLKSKKYPLTHPQK